MKAKDYLKEFGPRLIAAEDDFEKFRGVASQLIIRFNSDLKEVQKQRHIRTDKGLFPLLKEFNDKWNAFVGLLEKEYGYSPIVRDGYKKFWLNEMPSLGMFWK